jgi:hypothetical protein
MWETILGKMTGEELLLLRILQGEKARSSIAAELDRRAFVWPAHVLAERMFAERAQRKTLRRAAA